MSRFRIMANVLIATLLMMSINSPDCSRPFSSSGVRAKDSTSPGPSTAAGAGDLIAFNSDRGGSEEIYVMNSDGTGQTRLTLGLDASDPSLSPDGNRIAFTCNLNGSLDVCLIDSDGSNLVNLTHTPNGYLEFEPDWSPDGQWIAFTHGIGDGISVIKADGTGRQVLYTSLAVYNPAWSPDGSRIAFNESTEIMIMDSDGSNVMQLTSGDWPEWSPDGSKIVFSCGGICTINPNGSSQTQLTSTAGACPTWSPDGTQIAFASSHDGDWEIYVMNADGSNQIQLTSNSASDWHPSWGGGGGGPTPFLSSPCGSNCVVTSYFDHCYPTYRSAPNCCSADPLKYMCPYWAAESKHAAWYPDGSWHFQCDQSDTRQCWWYSGHNGYDYAGFSTVLAAAAGQVIYIGCANPTQRYPCPSSYGLIVDIDHQNGYLTRYGHLSRASVESGDSVSAGYQIGFVGNTGVSTGPHLHFTVYEDVNGNGQVDSGDKPVDPYGPNPPRGDLWRTHASGAPSHWLWTHSAPTSGSLTPAAGGGLMAPDGDVTVTVPTGAVVSEAVLYYTVVPEPPYVGIGAGAVAGERFIDTTVVSAGHTFSLSATDEAGNPVVTLLSPAVLTVTFGDTDLTYVSSDTLGIYLWDESASDWTPLSSNLDLAGKAVSTTITTLGIYNLRGQPSNPPPTILAIDPGEGDNTIDVQITISGANFLDNAFVRIGEWYMPSVYLVSTSTLTATLPAGLGAGRYAVTVENPDGQSATLSDAFSSIGKVHLPFILRSY